MSFERQPQPVSPIAYAAPIRRNTIANSEPNRYTAWLRQDPYGNSPLSGTPHKQSSRPATALSRHRSWFNQDPYGAPQYSKDAEHRHTRTRSWFNQDPYGKPRQSTSSTFSSIKKPFSSKSRPSIGAPTDFRKLTNPLTEPMPARRRSFRPLELSIYVELTGRLSPLPDFSTDDWELTIPGVSKPPTALLRRETVDNSLLPSDFSIPRKPLSTYSGYNSRRDVVSEPFLLSLENGPGPVLSNSIDEEQVASDRDTIDSTRTPTLPASQMDEMAFSASQPWSQRSSGYSVTRSRPQPSVLKHSRTESESRSLKSSFRRSKDDAVEQAIQELNTIVEEKRIKAKMESLSSPPLSPTSHKPAIAPAMTVRARSETLSDIGSAFSTSLAAPLPAGSSPVPGSTRTFVRSPLPGHRLRLSDAPSRSADSSATALPQMPVQDPVQSPKASNPLKSNPIRSQPQRKDRLSSWLKRVSTNPVETIPPTTFYQLNSKEVGGRPVLHVRSSASLDTITTIASDVSVNAASNTPATTIAPSLSPTSPTESNPRPSISKTPQALRRAPKRGLSIDTTMSNGSRRTVPPAYHEVDPHPPLMMPGELTPSRIGVAC